MDYVGRPLLACMFLVLLLLQWRFPLRRQHFSMLHRLIRNFVLSLPGFAIVRLAMLPIPIAVAIWAQDRHIGLLNWLALPTWAAAIATFLLMDYAYWWWHWANHMVPVFWRFHNVHHTDPELDVSTAFRFHFGEIALSSGFNIVQITLIGISPWAFAIYQLAFQSEVLFHHSNLRLPIRFERFLNKLIVTPRMHGIHHSQIHRENNSNFGTVFPWWDRLHRTLGLNIPQSEIAIGIPAYSLPEDNTVPNALLMPFRKQRDYWRTPTGAVVEREKASAEPNPARLAE